MGGVTALTSHLETWTAGWPEDRSLRLLVVGTGLADIPMAVVRWAQRTSRSVSIVATDVHETTLSIAREFVGGCPCVTVQRIDARELTKHFEPGSFDFVHASMVLHHFEDIEVITVLRMMDRIASCGVVWNDVVRSTMSRLLARLNFAAPKWVRQDAVASVRAWFTRRETLGLASRAGWEGARYRTHMGYRFTLTTEH